MAKLTESDKFYIQNHRNVDPKTVAKAIEKPIKLVAEYITSLPAPKDDFTVKKSSIQEGMTKQNNNTTVMNTSASEAMSQCLGKKQNYDGCVQKIRN